MLQVSRILLFSIVWKNQTHFISFHLDQAIVYVSRELEFHLDLGMVTDPYCLAEGLSHLEVAFASKLRYGHLEPAFDSSLT